MSHRILHVIPTLRRGSAEQQMALVAGEAPRDAFEMNVCAIRGGGPWADELREQGVQVHVLDRPRAADPRACTDLKRLANRLQPALVHTWRPVAARFGRTAAGKAGSRRLVASRLDPDRPASWPARYLDRRLHRRADRVVCENETVLALCRRLGIAEEKLRLIPAGVPPLGSGPMSREALLEALGIPAGARLVGAVASLVRREHVKDLIWAADLLKVIRDDVHLLIVGGGPHHRRLQKFRRQVQIEDKVHFLGEDVDPASLVPHLDVIWHAGSRATTPVSVLLAMAAGKPVVACDLPPSRELAVDGETGLFFEPGDRANLAAKTRKLLDEPELALSLGEAGHQRFLAHFQADQMVERYTALYRELLD